MSTIKDVAKCAGVSVSTVSRVISGNGYVSGDARQRVERAMKTLDFVPSGLARGLVSRKTSSIGLLIPDVANPFFADVARGVEDQASVGGFSVILCNSDWRVDRERMYIEILRSRWVDGVVIAGARSEERSLREVLHGLPFVLVDRRGSDGTDSIWTDNELGGWMATRHLHSRGCRKVVHLSGPEDSPSAQARRKGYLRAVKEAVLEPCVMEGDFRFESGFKAVEKLQIAGDIPDGIFAGNDMMAIGVLQAAQSLGWSVPRRVKVVGYDNISFAAYVSPALTTVEQTGYAMGRESARVLLDAIGNVAHEVRTRELRPKLVPRASTIGS